MTTLAMTIEDRAGSNVLERRRAEIAMPKAELSRRAGISERTVKYYLGGERAMTLGAYHTLRAILGLGREEAARLVAAEIIALENAEK